MALAESVRVNLFVILLEFVFVEFDAVAFFAETIHCLGRDNFNLLLVRECDVVGNGLTP